jgi:hypothetical protein
MADVASNLKDWSTTASSNSPSDATTIGAGLADNFQQAQATVRQDLASKGADIASATTTDLGAVPGHQHDITGTTTITGFGAVSAGIWKIIKFEGALTLTHNATSLILPGGANITTADGDVAIMVSEGSGNWRCASYTRTALGYVVGSYTGTATGLTTGETGTVNYTVHGSVVTLDLPQFSGTSNATSFTITGAPAVVRPSATKQFIVRTVDNSGAAVASLASIDSGGVITLSKNLDSGAAWTGSGTKQLLTTSVSYTKV